MSNDQRRCERTEREADDNDGDDDEYFPKTIRLYQPILYGRKPRQDVLTCSYVGGDVDSVAGATPVPVCPCCNDRLCPLLQLYVPREAPRNISASNKTKIVDDERRRLSHVDHTLQVFACNRAACINGLFDGEDDGSTCGNPSFWCGGGEGVVVCRRFVVMERDHTGIPSPEASASADVALSSSVWVDDDNVEESTLDDGVACVAAAGTDDDNEWSLDIGGGDTANGEAITMGEIEAQLAAMEASSTFSSKSNKKKSGMKKEQGASSPCRTFPCYELHSLREPPAPVCTTNRTAAMDEDDVGIDGGDEGKIQRMLERYMAEEDDEEILNALRVADGTGFGGVAEMGGGRERDERLSTEDRVLLTYSDRLKRSPRQVVRHAPGAIPIWSL